MPRRCALAPLAITHLNVLFPRLPPLLALPSGQPPTTRQPPPSARVLLLYLRCCAPRRYNRRRCRHRRCSFSLPLPYSAVSHDDDRRLLLSPALLPFVLSRHRREAAMTRVNLPQTPDRYRRTWASLSTLLRFFLRPIADNCHPPPPQSPSSPSPSSLHLSPFTPH